MRVSPSSGDEVEGVHDDVGDVDVEDAGSLMAEDRAAARAASGPGADLDAVGEDGRAGRWRISWPGWAMRTPPPQAVLDGDLDRAGEEVGGGKTERARGEGLDAGSPMVFGVAAIARIAEAGREGRIGCGRWRA